PMLGLLNPRSFMARADRSGLLPKLDFWVFERSCRQLNAWSMAGRVNDSFTMSINLAPAQLSNPGLRDHIARVIERYDIDPGMIQIEITEHSLVTDDVRVTKALGELKEQGLRLAIDDFGTLHANLDRVRNVPADALKIDMSFVTNIVDNANDRAIVTAVLNLGSALDLKTVAEGIESTDQAAVLTELGCGFGQGFLYGNPRSPDATAHLLAYGLVGEH
ncbi:MAG: EAL domain-containing protein, partial [Acidimicrobiales bacterium]|nr:EAL domain-containing protein [Acidimicrobiales bacterium]